MRRVLRSIMTMVMIAVLVAVGILFGPRLFSLFFGGASPTWVSERFSEELTAKRELVVLEKTITGQETVSTDAWLIGTVQEVSIPYQFSANFSIDLRQATVQYDETSNEIQVMLPPPTVTYYKLTVDEDSVKKYDFLYPLSAERYAEIKQEIEQKLYDEITNDAELKESAWASAVSETEALYSTVLATNNTAAAVAINVMEAAPQVAE